MKKDSIKDTIFLLELLKRISKLYDSKSSYKYGLNGLQLGLETYSKEKHTEKETPLIPYLTWYIKTGIEENWEDRARELSTKTKDSSPRAPV